MPGTNRLSRTKGARDALLKGLVTQLVEHGKVETTLAKAKEVKPLADSIISLAIKEAANFEEKEKTVSQLFEEQVEKTPNNIAIVFGDEKLTFKELNEKDKTAYFICTIVLYHIDGTYEYKEGKTYGKSKEVHSGTEKGILSRSGVSCRDEREKNSLFQYRP